VQRRVFAAVVVIALMGVVAAPFFAAPCCPAKCCKKTTSCSIAKVTENPQPATPVWSAAAPATALDFVIQSAGLRLRTPGLQASPPLLRSNSPLLI
jgi:hypothetical protein